MAKLKKSGLGRGLDALIPELVQEESMKYSSMGQGQATELKIKITEIEPNREQPRKDFNEEALIELSDSIRQYGILQPLLVKKKDDYYEIVAGERRWRAAKMAGLKEVPVIIKEYSEREIMEISLIENIQREDLNPIEEAMAYQKLLKEFSLTQEEVAQRVSKSRTAITNIMRLLKLDERVQAMVVEQEISGGHARTLLSIEDGNTQFNIAQKIVNESLSVRETERLVKHIMESKGKEIAIKKEIDTSLDIFYQEMEKKMKSIMGTKVMINKKSHDKGKIEIEYYSSEELERIMELFESIQI